ncbi:hypothetical protein [Streptacidiphilus anmyonensis]|uniref:hypothetical protein n=1 Tax=Streptacidiphilus anmyonensis TaxID=405782 RepID=UPI0005A6BC16|nr:hypothetical protein [Streptacidiphilus anmyonensis]
MTHPDDFDPAAFQAFCARFGIEATPYTDAFGRIDFRLDRANVEKLAHLKQLADHRQKKGEQR